MSENMTYNRKASAASRANERSLARAGTDEINIGARLKQRGCKAAVAAVNLKGNLSFNNNNNKKQHCTHAHYQYIPTVCKSPVAAAKHNSGPFQNVR